MLRAMGRPKKSGTNQVLLGDCVDLMRSMPAASADMIFADPPYNLQLDGELLRPNNTKVDGVAEEWDRFDGFADFAGDGGQFSGSGDLLVFAPDRQ